MANKKISQLTTTANVGAGDFFPVAVAGGGTPITKKAESPTLATYILNPVPSSIPSIGFTGTQNVYFDKSNWVDTTAVAGDGGTHAYVMVNKTDGQLTTGSGIANPVGGDNMGNCVATTNVNMSNNSITNIASLFFNQTASTVVDEDGSNLVVQAAQDLTVSGIRHVHISGQALDLASTPISGNMDISRGLNLQGGDVSITNNATGTLTVDNIVYSKRAYQDGFENVALATEIDWADGNVFKASCNVSPKAYTFANVEIGQTITVYMKNTMSLGSASAAPSFTDSSMDVYWPADLDNVAPPLANGKSNVYTFISIQGKIYASAITGYTV
tara:strand:+ start:2499 stop:3485 length:987 start_codon:yes stop_codon:yes gene_type:complete